MLPSSTNETIEERLDAMPLEDFEVLLQQACQTNQQPVPIPKHAEILKELKGTREGPGDNATLSNAKYHSSLQSLNNNDATSHSHSHPAPPHQNNHHHHPPTQQESKGHHYGHHHYGHLNHTSTLTTINSTSSLNSVGVDGESTSISTSTSHSLPPTKHPISYYFNDRDNAIAAASRELADIAIISAMATGGEDVGDGGASGGSGGGGMRRQRFSTGVIPLPSIPEVEYGEEEAEEDEEMEDEDLSNIHISTFSPTPRHFDNLEHMVREFTKSRSNSNSPSINKDLSKGRGRSKGPPGSRRKAHRKNASAIAAGNGGAPDSKNTSKSKPKEPGIRRIPIDPNSPLAKLAGIAATAANTLLSQSQGQGQQIPRGIREPLPPPLPSPPRSPPKRDRAAEKKFEKEQRRRRKCSAFSNLPPPPEDYPPPPPPPEEMEEEEEEFRSGRRHMVPFKATLTRLRSAPWKIDPTELEGSRATPMSGPPQPPGAGADPGRDMNRILDPNNPEDRKIMLSYTSRAEANMAEVTRKYLELQSKQTKVTKELSQSIGLVKNTMDSLETFSGAYKLAKMETREEIRKMIGLPPRHIVDQDMRQRLIPNYEPPSISTVANQFVENGGRLEGLSTRGRCPRASGCPAGTSCPPWGICPAMMACPRARICTCGQCYMEEMAVGVEERIKFDEEDDRATRIPLDRAPALRVSRGYGPAGPYDKDNVMTGDWQSFEGQGAAGGIGGVMVDPGGDQGDGSYTPNHSLNTSLSGDPGRSQSDDRRRLMERQKRKNIKSNFKEVIVESESISGYRGRENVEELLQFLEGSPTGPLVTPNPVKKKPGKNKERGGTKGKDTLVKSASLDENHLNARARSSSSSTERPSSKSLKEVEKKSERAVSSHQISIPASSSNTDLSKSGHPDSLPLSTPMSSSKKSNNASVKANKQTQPSKDNVSARKEALESRRSLRQREDESGAERPFELVTKKKKHRKTRTQREAESFSRGQAKDASRREKGRSRRGIGKVGKDEDVVCSAPGSDHSGKSDDDSVRSLPANGSPSEKVPKPCASSDGTPQTSYADIAKVPEPNKRLLVKGSPNQNQNQSQGSGGSRPASRGDMSESLQVQPSYAANYPSMTSPPPPIMNNDADFPAITKTVAVSSAPSPSPKGGQHEGAANTSYSTASKEVTKPEVKDCFVERETQHGKTIGVATVSTASSTTSPISSGAHSGPNARQVRGPHSSTPFPVAVVHPMPVGVVHPTPVVSPATSNSTTSVGVPMTPKMNVNPTPVTSPSSTSTTPRMHVNPTPVVSPSTSTTSAGVPSTPRMHVNPTPVASASSTNVVVPSTPKMPQNSTPLASPSPSTSATSVGVALTPRTPQNPDSITDTPSSPLPPLTEGEASLVNGDYEQEGVDPDQDEDRQSRHKSASISSSVGGASDAVVFCRGNVETEIPNQDVGVEFGFNVLENTTYLPWPPQSMEEFGGSGDGDGANTSAPPASLPPFFTGSTPSSRSNHSSSAANSGTPGGTSSYQNSPLPSTPPSQTLPSYPYPNLIRPQQLAMDQSLYAGQGQGGPEMEGEEGEEENDAGGEEGVGQSWASQCPTPTSTFQPYTSPVAAAAAAATATSYDTPVSKNPRYRGFGPPPSLLGNYRVPLSSMDRRPSHPPYTGGRERRGLGPDRTGGYRARNNLGGQSDRNNSQQGSQGQGQGQPLNIMTQQQGQGQGQGPPQYSIPVQMPSPNGGVGGGLPPNQQMHYGNPLNPSQPMSIPAWNGMIAAAATAHYHNQQIGLGGGGGFIPSPQPRVPPVQLPSPLSMQPQPQPQHQHQPHHHNPYLSAQNYMGQGGMPIYAYPQQQQPVSSMGEDNNFMQQQQHGQQMPHYVPVSSGANMTMTMSGLSMPLMMPQQQAQQQSHYGSMDVTGSGGGGGGGYISGAPLTAFPGHSTTGSVASLLPVTAQSTYAAASASVSTSTTTLTATPTSTSTAAAASTRTASPAPASSSYSNSALSDPLPPLPAMIPVPAPLPYPGIPFIGQMDFSDLGTLIGTPGGPNPFMYYPPANYEVPTPAEEVENWMNLYVDRTYQMSTAGQLNMHRVE